ncbi:MAG TPA: hypothetical protein VHA33_26700 [Candidatus Angelobacter sp.]|jgi:hypothetical protein|nr:hypothetical protein [Candidatus Angelobacter sp.]
MVAKKKTSANVPPKKRGRRPATEKEKKEKLRQKREDLVAFRERMKKFGQELLRQRRAELDESKSYKRILL